MKRDIATGVFESRRRGRKKKLIFLPMSQVMRVKGGKDIPEETELMPGITEIIRRIDRSAYFVTVYLPSGIPKADQLKEIYARMETLLGENGAYLDGIYDGTAPDNDAENSGEQRTADLRTWAETELNADMMQSWMLAETDEDAGMGRQAGCRIVMLTPEENVEEAVRMILSDPAQSLPAASGY